MAAERIYVLDTNVLLHDPESIFSFKGALVGIPVLVLEELDRFKGETTDRGHSSRQVIRYLDKLRGRGSLRDGVELENGGMLKVLFAPENKVVMPAALSYEVMDNLILMTILGLKQMGYDVQFITKDLNARVKADVLGISAQDYLKGYITPETFYKGWTHFKVPAISLKKDFPVELQEIGEHHDLILNEFVLLESNNNPFHYKIFRYLGNKAFKAVSMPALGWPLEPRNVQQIMALDLLFDESIQLVTLLGPAGTGKTFLALLAGIYQVLAMQHYEKMLVSRPVIPLGPDIGYLPGTIQEKMHSWMQPIHDNMEFIVHTVNKGGRQPEGYEADVQIYSGKRHDKKNKKKAERHEKIPALETLVKEGKISLEAITYMRGRSIPYQYILIDEVQNLTPHEVKTLISRVGEGSKIVLAGDPYQIDSPYLDFSSNGVVVATNKFKGQQLFGTVFLHSSERSLLSRLVSEIW